MGNGQWCFWATRETWCISDKSVQKKVMAKVDHGKAQKKVIVIVDGNGNG